MKKKLLIAAGVVVLLLVGVVIGVVVKSGDLLKAGVETGGTQAMKVQTLLGSAGLSILDGAVSLHELNVKNPEGFSDGYVFQVGDTSVDTNLGSLLSDTIEVEHIRIASPHVSLEVTTKGTNLGELLANLEQSRVEAEVPPSAEPAEPAEPAAEGGKGTQLIVRQILITDAKVSLTQTIFGSSGLEFTLPKLELTDVGTEQDPASMARLLQQVVAAIMTGILTSDQIPPELAALLRGELAIPSLDALKAQLEQQLQAGLAQGKAALQEGMDQAKQQLDDAKGQVQGKVDETKAKLQEKLGGLGESLGGQGEAAGEAAGAAGEKAGETVNEAGEKVDEQAQKAGEQLDEGAQKAGDKVNEEADKLKGKLGGLFGK